MTAPINTFRGRFLPYCLIPIEGGRHLVVNRSYKPLGEVNFVDYDAHPAGTRIHGLTPASIAKIAATGVADADGRIYLYNDGCVPTDSDANWQAYQARLKALSRLKVD